MIFGITPILANAAVETPVRVAIMPLKAISAGKHAYIGGAVEEILTSRLASDSISVVAPLEIRDQIKKKGLSSTDITASALDVDYIITGEVSDQNQSITIGLNMMEGRSPEPVLNKVFVFETPDAVLPGIEAFTADVKQTLHQEAENSASGFMPSSASAPEMPTLLVPETREQGTDNTPSRLHPDLLTKNTSPLTAQTVKNAASGETHIGYSISGNSQPLSITRPDAYLVPAHEKTYGSSSMTDSVSPSDQAGLKTDSVPQSEEGTDNFISRWKLPGEQEYSSSAEENSAGSQPQMPSQTVTLPHGPDDEQKKNRGWFSWIPGIGGSEEESSPGDSRQILVSGKPPAGTVGVIMESAVPANEQHTAGESQHSEYTLSPIRPDFYIPSEQMSLAALPDSTPQGEEQADNFISRWKLPEEQLVESTSRGFSPEFYSDGTRPQTGRQAEIGDLPSPTLPYLTPEELENQATVQSGTQQYRTDGSLHNEAMKQQRKQGKKGWLSWIPGLGIPVAASDTPSPAPEKIESGDSAPPPASLTNSGPEVPSGASPTWQWY